MGRMYSGDIDGKFWFAVQSSDDPSFFGGEETEPSVIEYFFGEEHLKDIKAGIRKCKKALGKYKKKLDVFFKDREGYSDEMLVAEFKIPKKKVMEILTWYARLELGEKILKCVKETGQCQFDAEL